MSRLSAKRSDRRWKDEHGTVWASKFEYQVYVKLCAAGLMVRKCEQGSIDTLAYTTPIRQGRCTQCGSGSVVQERTYTADVYLGPDPTTTGKPSGLYIETKGFFPAEKRGLLRHFRKTGPDVNLCVIANADHWVTKGRSRLSDYFARYLKDVPFHIFRGTNPDKWVIPEEFYDV